VKPSRARSGQEFIAKIDLCSQESDETQLWLELLEEECGIPKSQTKPVWMEADELIRIFVTMSKKTKKRIKTKSSGLRFQVLSVLQVAKRHGSPTLA